LWKVDDQATQELMSKFYSSWLKAGEKQHSFRDAQLSLREKFSHPYYWGAFVMVGK
jgi:CHAT domain-containing protein